MLDLWCHTRARPLTVLTGALIRPFAWLDRRVPALRRHGYLIVAVGEKPVTATTAEGASIPAATHGGVEHAVDAHHCDPAMLSSLPTLQRLFGEIISDLNLRPVDRPMWHVFPVTPASRAPFSSPNHTSRSTYAPKPVLRRSTVLLSFQSGLAVGKAPSRATRARAVTVRTFRKRNLMRISRRSLRSFQLHKRSGSAKVAATHAPAARMLVCVAQLCCLHPLKRRLKPIWPDEDGQRRDTQRRRPNHLHNHADERRPGGGSRRHRDRSPVRRVHVCLGDPKPGHLHARDRAVECRDRHPGHATNADDYRHGRERQCAVEHRDHHGQRPGRPVPANNSATVSVTPEQANLGLTKTVSNGTPNVGDQITFTVFPDKRWPECGNQGPVTDLLPVGLTFVSATPSQGTYVSGSGVWTVGTVTLGPATNADDCRHGGDPSAMTNTATISDSDQFDPNPANNTASATETPQQASLAMAKTVSNATPIVRGTITFTITLTNSGPNTATGVQVADVLPAGLTFVSATVSQGTYTPATGLWDVGTVNAGTPRTLKRLSPR